MVPYTELILTSLQNRRESDLQGLEVKTRVQCLPPGQCLAVPPGALVQLMCPYPTDVRPIPGLMVASGACYIRPACYSRRGHQEMC